MRSLYSDRPHLYQTADYLKKADLKLDIESTGLEDNCFATIICNHVLEHVNDRKALKELHRLLTPDGRLVLSVPLVEGWSETYENTNVTTSKERLIHFGQEDHVRYYGNDFRDKLNDAGFTFEEFCATGADVVTYSLIRGEKIFICRKAP